MHACYTYKEILLIQIGELYMAFAFGIKMAVQMKKALELGDLSKFKITDFKLSYFMAREIATSNALYATAFVAVVKQITPGVDESQWPQHGVVLKYTQDEEGIENLEPHCHDRYMSGADSSGSQSTIDHYMARINKACEKVPVFKRDFIKKEISSLFGSWNVPESGRDDCNFYAIVRSSSGETLCEHTYAFLRYLAETRPNYQQELKQLYEEGLSLYSTKVSDKFDGLEPYFFKVPVMLVGERGVGKTVLCRSIQEEYNATLVEYGGHEETTSIDLLGTLYPHQSKGLIWLDGPLTEAFRLAAAGTKVVLFLDELLRIPQRQLSILLNALSPTKEKTYKLRTGRIISEHEGVGKQEEIVCPISNICVIAATNIGTAYAVDEWDPALKERFIIHHKVMPIGELSAILKQLCVAKNFDVAYADKAIEFHKAMLKLKNSSLINEVTTARTLSRGFELAITGDEVYSHLLKQDLLWVAFTSEGTPVDEQRKSVKDALDKAFSVSSD